MVGLQDGPALCTSGSGTSGVVRGKFKTRHKSGTTETQDRLEMERDMGFEPTTFSLGIRSNDLSPVIE